MDAVTATMTLLRACLANVDVINGPVWQLGVAGILLDPPKSCRTETQLLNKQLVSQMCAAIYLQSIYHSINFFCQLNLSILKSHGPQSRNDVGKKLGQYLLAFSFEIMLL